MDKDKNRFLTYKELMELFKETYGDQKSLLKVFNTFASVQNQSLINYEALFKSIKQILLM